MQVWAELWNAVSCFLESAGIISSPLDNAHYCFFLPAFVIPDSLKTSHEGQKSPKISPISFGSHFKPLNFHTSGKWRLNQHRNWVSGLNIFGKAGLIPLLLPFLSSPPPPSHPIQTQGALSSPGAQRKVWRLQIGINFISTVNKQKNDHIGVRFLINIRPDVGWGFSLDFCWLLAFQESFFYFIFSFFIVHLFLFFFIIFFNELKLFSSPWPWSALYSLLSDTVTSRKVPEILSWTDKFSCRYLFFMI